MEFFTFYDGVVGTSRRRETERYHIECERCSVCVRVREREKTKTILVRWLQYREAGFEGTYRRFKFEFEIEFEFELTLFNDNKSRGYCGHDNKSRGYCRHDNKSRGYCWSYCLLGGGNDTFFTYTLRTKEFEF